MNMDCRKRCMEFHELSGVDYGLPVVIIRTEKTYV